MDAFELRAATPADADAVADYHHRCFTTTYSSQLLAGELEAPDPAGTRQTARSNIRVTRGPLLPPACPSALVLDGLRTLTRPVLTVAAGSSDG
jgi:hypothetical protein